ncbi:ATP-binding protein [Noviherbaspirillum sp. ST9]|uniref:ATP-binding protein n=1 Tax=Noviherbaspirillum sp. ST9 TaxID=3401606 RepID=UPI003B5892E6
MEPTGNSFLEYSEGAVARFDARLDALPAAVEFAHAALRLAGIPQERVSRCDLVLEELFRNSVLHGHGGDSAHSIWIGIEDSALWYEDEAPAFDPLSAALPDGGAVRTVEEQRVGGVGLMLIRELPSQVAYFYRNGRNRLVIVP